MTVRYLSFVTKHKSIAFLRLLFWWRGSLYKYVLFNFVIYVLLYFIVFTLYKSCPGCKTVIGNIVIYCRERITFIPVGFVLGFFVSLIVARRWAQFVIIPWIDRICIYLNTFIQGNNERCTLYRRTVVRYMNLSAALSYRSFSCETIKLFPTLQHLVNAGLMTDAELFHFSGTDVKYNKFYVPIVWALSLLKKAREEDLIDTDRSLDLMVQEVCAYRDKLQMLFFYDWVNPPLVYTQVTAFCVYTYFIAAVIAAQPLDDKELGPYNPTTVIIQFVVYMGWLQVGTHMINPFGEDSDSFEINIILERNVQAGYFYVDKMHHVHPALLKDCFWNKTDFRLNTLCETHTTTMENFSVDYESEDHYI